MKETPLTGSVIQHNNPKAPLSRDTLFAIHQSIAQAYLEHIRRAIESEYPNLPRSNRVAIAAQCAVDTLHWGTDWAKDYSFYLLSTGTVLELKLEPKNAQPEKAN